MSIPPSVGSGTITGVTLRTSDGSPVAGVQFIFTPALQPGLVTVAGSVPPVVIAVDPVVGVTNSAGVLCGPDGVPGVVLTASSDVDVSPSGWTWVATTPGTSSWPSTAASFVLAPGEVKDLTTITTLSPSLGVEIAAWTAVVTQVTGLRDQAATSASSATASATAAATSATNSANSAATSAAAATAALALKANIASPTFTGTVSGITAAMVGLANVGNTSDAAKPVSTAQQTALNLKANLASPTFTGTVAGITPTMVSLGNVNNTTDASKPVSTAQQTALNLKANLAGPTFTGTVSGITAAMVGLGNVDNTTDAAKPVSTAGQTALNLKADLIAPAIVAATPAPTFGADLAPALSTWAPAGGASFSAPNMTVPNGGSFSATIAGLISGQTYQVDLTRTGGTGSDLTVTLGAATPSFPSFQPSVTIIATASGSLLLTIGGFTAVVSAVVVRQVTAFASPVFTGVFQARAVSNNNAVGSNAQQRLTTGNNNNAVGGSAQSDVTVGAQNNAVGGNAQQRLTTGSNNNAVGHAAQTNLTTGLNNNAFGADAQRELTSGQNNNAFGLNAQFTLTTGSNNNAVGREAQRALTTGSNNNAVGRDAQRAPLGNSAFATTTGGNQVSVGHETGQNTATQLAEITTIGHRATAGANKGTALGAFSRADHADSVALGSDTTTTFASQVMVGGRDIEITTATTRGIILRSPDGTRYRIAVANGGTLTVTAV